MNRAPCTQCGGMMELVEPIFGSWKCTDCGLVHDSYGLPAPRMPRMDCRAPQSIVTPQPPMGILPPKGPRPPSFPRAPFPPSFPGPSPPPTPGGNYFCNGCNARLPASGVGRHYRCQQCPDFDLCASCVGSVPHNNLHQFRDVHAFDFPPMNQWPVTDR